MSVNLAAAHAAAGCGDDALEAVPVEDVCGIPAMYISSTVVLCPSVPFRLAEDFTWPSGVRFEAVGDTYTRSIANASRIPLLRGNQGSCSHSGLHTLLLGLGLKRRMNTHSWFLKPHLRPHLGCIVASTTRWFFFAGAHISVMRTSRCQTHVSGLISEPSGPICGIVYLRMCRRWRKRGPRGSSFTTWGQRWCRGGRRAMMRQRRAASNRPRRFAGRWVL